MRLTAIPAFLILAVASVAAHAATISVTGVSSFPITTQSPNNDNDALSFSAVPLPGVVVANGGTFSQPGNFYGGYIPTQPSPDPFSFQDTFTVNGISNTLTFTGTDTVTDANDTLTIDALGPVAFGSTTLTFGQVLDVNYYSDGSIPVSLDATVSSTPEPSSLALLGTGLLSVAGAARRRMKR